MPGTSVIVPPLAGVVDGRGGREEHPAKGQSRGSGPEASAGDPRSKGGWAIPSTSGLEETASGLCQADERLAKKVKPIYRELAEAIWGSMAVHANEMWW